MISINLIKNCFLFIAGFVAGAFLFKGCNKPCAGNTVTVVKHDTTIVTIKIPDTTSSWHKPDAILEGGNIDKAIQANDYWTVDNPNDVVTKNTHDDTIIVSSGEHLPLIVHSIIYGDGIGHVTRVTRDPIDHGVFVTESGLPNVFEKRYAETYHFPEGDVLVKTIGLVDSQQVSLINFHKEVINTTTTIKESVGSTKHNEMYLGISAMGNMVSPFYAFGPSLSFKTKSDKVLEAGVLYTRSNSIMYQAGIKFKISLRKQ
jgi:hypothetical protein